MKPRLVVLRPEPGSSATRERAQAAGWDVHVAPLFEIAPIDWQPPDPAGFDAVLMTSANAARHGGKDLAGYAGLPLYAVGEATAQAARDRGFISIEIGRSGVVEIADRLRCAGKKRVVHFSGTHVRPFDSSGLDIHRIPVYATEPREPQGLRPVLAHGALVALHSPRAARHFADWCARNGEDRTRIAIAAISEAALNAAGTGWNAACAAPRPDDAALLAAADALIGKN